MPTCNLLLTLSLMTVNAYIATGGILIYPKGQLKHDSYITIKPFSKWASVSTGLEPVKEQPLPTTNDFDELFDCPFYIGNQEFYPLRSRHQAWVAFENPANLKQANCFPIWRKMVEAASHVIGDIHLQKALQFSSWAMAEADWNTEIQP